MKPFEVYKTYLSIKNHFTKPSYDYHKYSGKTSCTLNSFYKRKDRFHFEKLSRQKNDNEILNFFISNFVYCENPQTLWVGDVLKNGEDNYNIWNKRNQSLTYHFTNELKTLLQDKNIKELFEVKGNQHPIIVKEYLRKNVSIETLTILDKIFDYTKYFDRHLTDPIWKFLSLRIKKYRSFLHINQFKFKKIIKTTIHS